jgi:hypothetical protein
MKDAEKIQAVRAMPDKVFYLGWGKFCFEGGLKPEELDVFVEALNRAKASPPGEKWRRLTISVFAKVVREGELEHAIGAAFSCGQAYEMLKRERGWQ